MDFLERILAGAERARQEALQATNIGALRRAEEREARYLQLAAIILLARRAKSDL